jgi:hypothetical protein
LKGKNMPALHYTVRKSFYKKQKARAMDLASEEAQVSGKAAFDGYGTAEAVP